MVRLCTSQRLSLRSTLSPNSDEPPHDKFSRTESDHLLFSLSLSLSACLLMFASVMTLHTHIFASRHSQFVSLSLRQHHGGCCFLPDGEIRAMRLGSLSGTRMQVSWKISQWCSSFRESKAESWVPKRRRENGDGAFSRRLVRGSTSVCWAKTSSLIKSARHLKRRKQTMNEKNRLSTNLFNRTRTI